MDADERKNKERSNMTVKGRENVFRDFERFLKTERVSLVGLPKKDMKKLYNNEYTAYKKQISPNEFLPSFFTLMTMFYQKRIGHFDADKKFCLGSPGKRRGKPQNNGQAVTGSPQHSSGSSDNASLSSPDNSPTHTVGRKPQHTFPSSGPARMSRVQRKLQLRSEMYKIAVDQHITAKPSYAQPSVEGPSLNYRAVDIDAKQEYAQNVERRGQFFVCTICQTRCLSQGDIMQHLSGKKHRLAVSIHLLKSKRPEMIQGTYGMDITSDLPGKEGTFFIDSEAGEVKLSDLIVRNKGNCVAELTNCEQMKTLRVFKLNDSQRITDGTGTTVLNPGESYTIQLRTKADHVGTYHSPVIFKFRVYNPENKSDPHSCYIVRYLHVRCTNSIVDDLQPTTPYKKPPRVAKQKGRCVEIEPGLKIKSSSSSDSLEKVVKLDQYGVPQDLRRMINRGLTNETHLTEGEKVELRSLRAKLQSPLAMDTYRQRFESLLFLEEVQMEVDIRKYDMEAVCLKPYPQNKRLLALQVPGLSENRPSVLKGDWLFVRICEADGKLSEKEYQGFVHEVLLNDVALGFSQSFRDKWIDKMKFNVRFVFNRLPLKLQHRACCLAVELSLAPVLFPKKLTADKVDLPRLRLYNSELERNEKQMCAVQHIVAGTSQPAPYIIFGPPGTGKTVTVVEAIKQVWKLSNTSHILACTPSNSAADLITIRLLQHIPRTEIIRLNAMSRSWFSVPDGIKDLCNYDKNTKDYYFPRKSELMNYRIIVTTLVTAGRLASACFPAEHFSHVFIDEGGHAIEPEALIGVAGIMECSNLRKGAAQLVIAGDPKQLGPVLRSPLAIEYGLDISLLERLMISCDLYQPMTVDGHKVYDVRVITKLLKNYRSHPAILTLPNKMFYHSELEPCANQIARERLCRWEGLPKPGFPVLFHSVLGADKREERSPSFFNPEEVSVVIKYAEELLTCKKGGINIKQEEIGIITPYRKQVEKIKQVLKKKNYNKVTVASVEEFQGQERSIIIVSTVRSKPEYLSLDLTYNLGFLRNPKRFNVTVTRAKALLVVIGNPNTLSKDPHWRQLIEYCEDAKSYLGINRMKEEEEIEDLIQRLNAVGILDENVCLTPEAQSAFNEQPWRSDH